jgi:beta-glucosidase
MKNYLFLIMGIFTTTAAASADSFTLPQDFRFCMSTAAYQVEGNDSNSDWWQWEQLPGKIKDNGKSGIATDSYNHLDEDIANMKTLGVTMYRFSIEWAKVEPQEGVFDEKMLDEYVDQIDRLNAAGIESMVTLYHFTFPVWVSNYGGWDWDGIAPAFQAFTEKVVQRIGPRVKIWITLNEPITIIATAYISDIFPPGKNDLHSIGVPMVNMVKAHALSYHKIHDILDTPTFKPQVGLAHHLRIFDPKHRHNIVDIWAARLFDQISNWSIPDALTTGEFKISIPLYLNVDVQIPEAIGTQDFFGLNYYSRDMISVSPFEKGFLQRQTRSDADVNDLGWEIYPEGMDRLLDQIQTRFPNMPIWITENGIADSADANRTQFIKDHLEVLADQIQAGAPIKGYCHWTLNDNFEWAEGWTAHFGLFSLEPGTLKRIARQSAVDFADIVQKVKAGLAIDN